MNAMKEIKMNKQNMQKKELVLGNAQIGTSCNSEQSNLDAPRTRSTASRFAAHSASGFTLIEVMVVIVILGVLAALIVPKVMGRGEKAKVDTSVIALKGVAGALDQYKLDNGQYPSMQDGGLDALVNQPASAKNWMQGGYVKGGYPKDSWDNDIQYVIPGAEGRTFDLYSFGADGQAGGEGTAADLYYQP